MAEVNVNPAHLTRVADAYDELAARTSLISPQAAVEVQRITETHGPMGYPVAVGITAGLAAHEGQLNAKAADFTKYSQRFSEHAAAYTREDRRGADRLRVIAWPAGLRDPLNQSHVDPRPPPDPHPPAGICCWIGTKNGDVGKLCPPETDTVTYVDEFGNYVAKDLGTGVETVMMRPGDTEGGSCWIGSRGADRSICGPGAVRWEYAHDGYLITEELGPDGKIHYRFRTPLGPLIP